LHAKDGKPKTKVETPEVPPDYMLPTPENSHFAHMYSYTISEQRILIVDDEEAVRSVFSSSLGSKYDCSTAASFDEAMALLASESFALVITDLIMPGRSGIELLREITARFPDTFVIVASGVDRSQRVIDAIRLGASDYLIKPCDMDVLDITVDRALQRRALVRNARRYKLDLERRNNELRESKAKLQRLQAEIVKNEKMASLGVLAAGVAHELNNPAGFIIGNLEILKHSAGGFACLLKFYEELSLGPVETEALKQLKDEIDYENTFAELSLMIADCCDGAERIRDVVQNLQTFSRQDQADYKKIDIHEGIESTIHFLARYYSSGSINLFRDYATLPMVDCFAGQLNQVWMNLLANAADAVETGGDVFISTSQLNGKVIVKISDTGCGMQPEHLTRIFDPFFTTKSVGKGTGLGLSVSYSIIERHSGSIEVESLPGQGTTFRVILPIDAVQSLNEYD